MVVHDKNKASKRYEPKQCPECGKQVLGEQGLWGHLCLAHGIKKLSRETSLAKQIDELKTVIASKDQEITNLKQTWQKGIADLKNNILTLQSEKDAAIEQARNTYQVPEGDYCPLCGDLISKHKLITDIGWGTKRYRCPG
jgi:hypothetical protein